LKRTKEEARKRRKMRVRKKVFGTPERPRLAVFGSLNHIYAQVINDMEGRTIAAASTIEKEVREKIDHGGNVDSARQVGQMIAKRAVEKGVRKVVFDRGGFRYHGRIKALADAAREGGLEF